jgi:diacylglycerol kinase family enzyme
MNSWLAIVNRHCGGAGAQRRLHGTLDRLSRETDNIRFTEYPGHATGLAREACGYDGLAAVGGDGTVFEVLQGMDRQKQTLAVVPAGRGNSLARDLGLYPLSGAAPLASVRASRVDLMELVFEDRSGVRHKVVSASTIALGYPAEVAAVAGRRFRRFGSLCYAMAGACVVPAVRHLRVRYPNEPVSERRLTGFLASNTRHAANFEVFPHARYNDGSFEVMELMAGFAKQSLHNLSSLSQLRFYGPPARGKLTNVCVDCEEPCKLLVDGELYANVVSLEIRVLPAALACAT